MTYDPFKNIKKALTTHLRDMSGIPAVAWSGSEYLPIAGTPYIKPYFLFAEPQQAAIGDAGDNYQNGRYQLILVYPDREGENAVNTMVDKICERFKRGTILTYSGQIVTITKVYPSFSTIADGNIYQTVDIVFSAYTQN